MEFQANFAKSIFERMLQQRDSMHQFHVDFPAFPTFSVCRSKQPTFRNACAKRGSTLEAEAFLKKMLISRVEADVASGQHKCFYFSLLGEVIQFD